jgi:hypothetical protein
LHEDLDRAVLSVYGWNDLVVPPYCPVTDGDRSVSTTFEHAVFERLYALNAARSAAEPAAGLPSELPLPRSDSGEVDEPDWDEMQDLAVRQYRESAPTKNSDAIKSVDAMVNWFFERYEDPANGVPYDGKEGGYQYFAGGPYNAEDELRDAFDDGTKRIDRMIQAAVDRIERDGIEWVKRGEY